MPLYQVQAEQKNLKPMSRTTFADIEWRERQELQALLRDNSDVIAPNILIFSEEFSNWQESLRRVDLLGLDKDGNLIVIELKRVEDGGHMELQSIRYAAMLSGLDFEDIVTAYERLLSNPEIARKRQVTVAEAKQDLLKFFEVDSAEEIIITSNPRVFLLAPSFSKEITTTVLWLNDRGLDLRCMEINPYRIENGLYLNVEQIIPLPSADSLIVRKGRERAERIERQVTTNRREKTITTLVNQGVLRDNTPLYLFKSPRPGLEIPDENAKRAIFLENQKVRWGYDGNEYSLSGLCKVICETFGGSIGVGAFAGPDYWAVEGDTLPLSERAKLRATDTPRGGLAEEIDFSDDDEEASDRAFARLAQIEAEANAEQSNESTT